jgi:hypothetical protein
MIFDDETNYVKSSGTGRVDDHAHWTILDRKAMRATERHVACHRTARWASCSNPFAL